MKIAGYITEFKNRSLFILLTLIANFIILVFYKEQIIYLLGQHQENLFPYFITTDLTEIFFSFIKLNMFLAFYCLYPFLLSQIWLFLIPGLYEHEYKILRNLFCISLILYITCTITTYKIFLPYCWKFFSSFELKAEDILVSLHLETRLNEYLSFFIKIFFALNILFHAILILAIVIKKFNLKSLIKKRKLIYLIFFVIATLFTPPDVFSQLFLGIFLIFFFEIFLLSLFIFYEYKKGE